MRRSIVGPVVPGQNERRGRLIDRALHVLDRILVIPRHVRERHRIDIHTRVGV